MYPNPAGFTGRRLLVQEKFFIGQSSDDMSDDEIY